MTFLAASLQKLTSGLYTFLFSFLATSKANIWVGHKPGFWPVCKGKASLTAAVPWQEMHRPFPQNCDGRRSQGDHPSTYADVHADQRTFRSQESQLSACDALLRYGTL